MRVHVAFNTHVSKLSRLSTRSRRSKNRRFVYAKRQCASPQSFKPSQPKPPGRLHPTKFNIPSLKVPEIPIKTYLLDLWRYFHIFSRASPVDALFDSHRLPCHAQIFPSTPKFIIYKVFALPPSLDLPTSLTGLPAPIFATSSTCVPNFHYRNMFSLPLITIFSHGNWIRA